LKGSSGNNVVYCRLVITNKPGYSGHEKPPSRLVVAGLKVFVSQSGSVVNYKPVP
jgi:hypothetical protein